MQRYPPTCRHHGYEQRREAHRTRSSGPGRSRPDPARHRDTGPGGPSEDDPDQRRIDRGGRHRPEDHDVHDLVERLEGRRGAVGHYATADGTATRGADHTAKADTAT